MTSDWATDLALGTAVLLGASVQRLMGIGFALVAAPALVLLQGPAEGVLLSNCAALAISLVGFASEWRRIHLSAMVPLLIAAACTVPVGAWTAAHLPEPVLLVGIGVLVSAAVLLVMRGTQLPALRGLIGALTAGAAGGFMNSSAGVGGPVMSLYAVNAGWTLREFVPNAQLYGISVNVFSLAAKGLPQLTTVAWALTAAGIAAGALIGKLLGEKIPEHRARPLVLLLALAGGLITLSKGLWEL